MTFLGINHQTLYIKGSSRCRSYFEQTTCLIIHRKHVYMTVLAFLTQTSKLTNQMSKAEVGFLNSKTEDRTKAAYFVIKSLHK